MLLAIETGPMPGLLFLASPTGDFYCTDRYIGPKNNEAQPDRLG
jgi:hypothetical protein